MKYDFSSHVWLVTCKFVDGEETAATIKRYFLAYGIVSTWVSDQGRHFVKKIVNKVACELHCVHTRTTAYASWANGSVEVVMRMVLQIFRTLCLEMQRSFPAWPRLIGIVRSILNKSSSPKLNGRTSFEVFFARGKQSISSWLSLFSISWNKWSHTTP